MGGVLSPSDNLGQLKMYHNNVIILCDKDSLFTRDGRFDPMCPLFRWHSYLIKL